MSASVIHLLPPLKYFDEVWKLAAPLLDDGMDNHSEKRKLNFHRLCQVVEAVVGADDTGTLKTVARQLAHDWKEVMIRSLENPNNTIKERHNLLFGLMGHLIEFLDHVDEMRGDGFDTFEALMNLDDGEESCQDSIRN